ncbi:MAG: hypothetical protein ACYCOU_01195 [Sulfobacillus sp.]
MRDSNWNPVDYVGKASRAGYVILAGEAGEFCLLADDVRTEDETETALVQGTRAIGSVNPYQKIIAQWSGDYSPRHVEAYIRAEHGTLDGMDRATLCLETAIACGRIELEGQDMAERLAVSLGL